MANRRLFQSEEICGEDLLLAVTDDIGEALF